MNPQRGAIIINFFPVSLIVTESLDVPARSSIRPPRFDLQCHWKWANSSDDVCISKSESDVLATCVTCF